jgi:argininosuccinate lyase
MKKEIYRSRINESLDKKVLAFLSSLQEDLWIANEDIMGTEAHNIMLYEQNILRKEEIRKILNSLKKVREKFQKKTIKLTGNFEDIHPFIESFIIDDIGIEIGGKMHTGRSRNDQVSVDIRLKIRNELNDISSQLFSLLEILFNLSEKKIDIIFPLYTHLQKAQLGLFSHYLNYYSSQVLRIVERINEIYNRVNQNPLGACAIGGTNININRKRTTELLGFDRIIVNSIDAVSSRDYILETLMILSLLAMHLSRISEDLIIWASREFNYIKLHDKFCSVSSVMPQKRNPDSLELIRAKASIVISNVSKANLMVKATPSGYLRDFQELKPILRQSLDLIQSMIDMINGIFSTLQINKEHILEDLGNSFILALDLAELLVENYNIPFRKAHQIIGNLVKNLENPNDLFNYELIQKSIDEIYGKKISITKEEIRALSNLKNTLRKRISQGSTSKKEVSKFLTTLQNEKKQLYKKYLSRIENIKQANLKRKHLIKKITE